VRIGDIVGKEVVTKDGVRLGKVVDLLIARDNWSIVGLVVQLSKQVARAMGFKRVIRSQRVSIPTGYVIGVRDVVALTVTLEEVRPTLRPL